MSDINGSLLLCGTEGTVCLPVLLPGTCQMPGYFSEVCPDLELLPLTDFPHGHQ